MCNFRFYAHIDGIVKITGKQVFFPSQFTSEDDFPSFSNRKEIFNLHYFLSVWRWSKNESNTVSRRERVTSKGVIIITTRKKILLRHKGENWRINEGKLLFTDLVQHWAIFYYARAALIKSSQRVCRESWKHFFHGSITIFPQIRHENLILAWCYRRWRFLTRWKPAARLKPFNWVRVCCERMMATPKTYICAINPLREWAQFRGGKYSIWCFNEIVSTKMA